MIKRMIAAAALLAMFTLSDANAQPGNGIGIGNPHHAPAPEIGAGLIGASATLAGVIAAMVLLRRRNRKDAI